MYVTFKEFDRKYVAFEFLLFKLIGAYTNTKTRLNDALVNTYLL